MKTFGKGLNNYMPPKTSTALSQNIKNQLSAEQIELIKTTIAKDASDDELKLFIYTASRVGLDPLAKQIHFVKRGGQMTIQTGIDGYRAIAERTGTLAGIDDAIFDSETALHPNKASVTVYRMVAGQRVGFTASARWVEYSQPQGFMWKKMPYLMLAKCAEALALRKAFPNDLTGLYTNEEMAQADNVIQHVDVEVTPVSNTQSLPPNQPVQKTLTPQTTPPTTPPKKTCPNCKTEHTGQYPTCYDCYMMKRNSITPKVPAQKKDDSELTEEEIKAYEAQMQANKDTPPFP
jgi:phage recombination protein Bet